MSDPGYPAGPPLGPPTVGEPAWLPDPARRHELRWFDGVSFTDQVADGAFRSTDPGGPEPVAAGAGAGVAGAGGDDGARRQKRLPLVLVGVGLGAVLGGGAYLVFGGGDGGGFGSFEGSVGDEPGRHEISLSGGTAAVVRLDPSSELDAIVAFAVDDGDAERIADLYEDTPFANEAEASRGQLFRVDLGFDGDVELAFLAVPFGVDATVVVSGFDGSEGDYEIEIEKLDLDGIDDDADGDAVLEALVEADGIPTALRQTIESRLNE